MRPGQTLLRVVAAMPFALSAALALAQQAPVTLPEPQVNADHTVTFRYEDPNATKVELALENVAHPMAMQKSEAGMWTLTTEPLPSEYYSYHFVSDGLTRLDPRNPRVTASLTSAGNTFLLAGPDAAGVAPPWPSFSKSGPEPWEVTAVPHGVLHHHTFTTNVVLGLPANQDEFYVYTPPGYDPRASTKYPVLYLLHGWSDTATGWVTIGKANDILDGMIAGGKAKPMIVVMPLGYGDMSFVRDGFGVWQKPAEVEDNTSLFSQALLTEVIPQVEKLYRVSNKREDRAIAGLSMGGLEAVTIGVHHPEQFGWVGGFSAAVHLVKPEEFAAVDAKKAGLKLVYISCGTTDSLLEADRRLASTLRTEGFPVVTSETIGVGHVWLEWRPALVAFAGRIFQP